MQTLYCPPLTGSPAWSRQPITEPTANEKLLLEQLIQSTQLLHRAASMLGGEFATGYFQATQMINQMKKQYGKR